MRPRPSRGAFVLYVHFCLQYILNILTLQQKQDGIHCQRPTPPPPHLRETELWRCGRGGGRGGREEKVHLKTHAPLGGGVGKKQKPLFNAWIVTTFYTISIG